MGVGKVTGGDPKVFVRLAWSGSGINGFQLKIQSSFRCSNFSGVFLDIGDIGLSWFWYFNPLGGRF